MICAFVTVKTEAQGEPDEDSLLRHVEEIPALIAAGRLKRDDIPNPHWRDGACQACHAGKPGRETVRQQQGQNRGGCLFCHDARFDHSYIHPIDVRPDAEMIARMPADYQQTLDEREHTVTCQTCHDLPLQCLPQNRGKQAANPKFFRRGPFRKRSTQCYFCHDIKKYQRLNPHEQIAVDGGINENTCTICHSDGMPALLQIQGIENLGFYGEQDLSALCIRCHQVKPHPNVTFKFGADQTPPDHLVVPSAKKGKYMRKQAKLKSLVLPLEPGTGKIFCATCHNPHQQGLIRDLSADISPDNLKKRLRANRICVYCHDV